MRALVLFILRARYRFACRALARPYDPKASLRLDRALVALEQAKGEA